METIINSIVALVAAFLGAWLGAKFSAKEGEKSQREFLAKIDKAANSLSAIARRLPGGEAYAAVKQAEQQLAHGQKTENK